MLILFFEKQIFLWYCSQFLIHLFWHFLANNLKGKLCRWKWDQHCGLIYVSTMLEKKQSNHLYVRVLLFRSPLPPFKLAGILYYLRSDNETTGGDFEIVAIAVFPGKWASLYHTVSAVSTCQYLQNEIARNKIFWNSTIMPKKCILLTRAC